MSHPRVVTVIGASAVGCIAAKELAKKGLDVELLEADAVVGKFGKCGGIMSKRGMDGSGVNYKKIVLNEIKGANFYSASGERMKVRSSQAQAVVFSRQAFDELCADEAVAAGASLHLNSPATAFKANGSIEAITPKGSFSSKIIVGADGVGSYTAQQFKFPAFKERDIVMSYQAEFENVEVAEPDIVDVLLDAGAYKGFFAWTIPVSRDRIRIGIATTDKKSINEAVKACFANPEIKKLFNPDSRKIFDFYYSIPLFYRKKTQLSLPGNNHVALIGDAAGQVKATTGGGIVFGAKCAQVLAREAKKFSEGGAFDYEAVWRKEASDALRLHYLIHRFYGILPNPVIDALVSVSAKLKFNSFLEAFGDMDYILK